MDSLQFQKVEVEDTRPKCGACKAPMEGEFFQLAGRNICARCADVVRYRQNRPPMDAVLRGGLFGLGAAVGCAIVYALVTWMTGMSLALLSIAVGYLVGRAVRLGARGLGGLRCQAMAVALTYFAIAVSYVPVAIETLVKSGQAEFGLAQIAAASLAGPFLELGDGTGGILGIFIAFFGLAEAWRRTARDNRVLIGPYELTPAVPAAAPAGSAEGPAIG